MIAVAFTAIGGLVGGGAMWGRLTTTIDNNKAAREIAEKNLEIDISKNQTAAKEEDDKQWREIEKLRNKMDASEGRRTEDRLENEREMGKMREAISKWESKLDNILSAVETLTNGIESMRHQLNNLEARK